MNKIDPKIVILAKQNKHEHYLKGFWELGLSWKDIYDIYVLAYNDNNIIGSSFSTISIPSSEKYTDKYNNIIDATIDVHPGDFIQANLIIHLYAYKDNESSDIWLQKLRDLYLSHFNMNPPMPLTRSHFFATIHDDRSDGFFIQGLGSTEWAFEQGSQDHYQIAANDVLFIPKTLKHGVLSNSPRFALSISFHD